MENDGVWDEAQLSSGLFDPRSARRSFSTGSQLSDAYCTVATRPVGGAGAPADDCPDEYAPASQAPFVGRAFPDMS